MGEKVKGEEEEKVKGEEEELTKMTTIYTSNTDTSASCSGNSDGAAIKVMSLYQIVAQDNLENKEEATMMEAIIKA